MKPLPTSRSPFRGWTFWRRTAQLGGLALFLFLFLHTDYAGTDELHYAVNILFRLDPFLAASTWLGGHAWIGLMWPALLTILLTFLGGRFFCGWLCPLGTLLDLSRRLLPRPKHDPAPQLPTLRFQILVFLLAAAAFGLPFAGYLDPFSLLVRGLTLAISPGANAAIVAFFTFTYQKMPAWVNVISEPVYAALRATILPFSQKWFYLTFPALAMIVAVFLLELKTRRFFCRYLCPTGAVLGLTARFGLMKGKGGGEPCKSCQLCRNLCRMGAIKEERTIATAECILCMDCVVHCPHQRIGLSWQQLPSAAQPALLGRRALLSGLAAGLLLPLCGQARALGKRPEPLLIRPPGALPEPEFLGRCVRCGECMQVCIGNALQPAFLEAGLEGIFSPKLVPRIGYCEYNCTLCGQVCPTGAIRHLAVKEKQQVKIGRAWFDRNRCLPHAQGIPCLVCEEHCPTPEKAILFREATLVNSAGRTVTVKQPYVVEERCIGCGICERKCPLPGDSAIRVSSAGETRNSSQSGTMALG